jgi:ABC-type phosphate/phosphonate transport system substrate-binding protein
MIASLPMYAHPSNRAAHNDLWALIRDALRQRGIQAPDGLDHDIDHKQGWAHDDLVLGQICNLPYRKFFRDRVTLIGATDYGLNGCPAGHYRSAIVVRADAPASDPRAFAEQRFVCNDTLSHSGYGAAQHWASAHGFTFGVSAQTDSHHASINAVASGQADIAAIDMQSWRIECGVNQATAMLKIIDYTATSPGQSFITRKGEDPEPYLAAVNAAIAQLSDDAAAVLGLKAVVRLPASAYEMPFPPDPCENCP